MASERGRDGRGDGAPGEGAPGAPGEESPPPHAPARARAQGPPFPEPTHPLPPSRTALTEAGGGGSQFELDLSDGPEGALVLAPRGMLDAAAAARTWSETLGDVERRAPERVVVDASGLEGFDGAGAALLLALADRQAARGGAFEVRELAPDLRRLWALFSERERPEPGRPAPRPGIVERIGAGAIGVARDTRTLIAFTGELVLALLHALRRPRKVRWGDTLLIAETAGIDALPIVATVTFLIGLIMAFQSAIPMREFGADVFVANLVALSMLRELGPLMTAILLAGRSGSAFAAELGTMRVNQELDALTTMGLEPVRFLVVPRVLAALVVTPLLTVFANVCGILGGLVVYLTLGLPSVTYFNQVQRAADATDALSGLVKAFFFGVLVAAIGCYRGLSTGSGARAVGDSTTRAVVSGIVLIAVADGIFSVLYYVLDI